MFAYAFFSLQLMFNAVYDNEYNSLSVTLTALEILYYYLLTYIDGMLKYPEMRTYR